ncbi:hypothetical protein AGMMS49992_30500 [Clostridia bacterium]|nr:hypothetical protein AGMMS49992_30500 [Clostridia bacterium]
MRLFPTPETHECVIHSLDGKIARAEILGILDEKQYIARYNGVVCTAIFNVFRFMYYIDDKYGILPADWEKRYSDGC